MQDNSEENQDKSTELLNLTPEDRRNLVGFFALLIKVDKRINPTSYELKAQKND